MSERIPDGDEDRSARSRLQQLTLHNVTVRACADMHRQGAWSNERALIEMVLRLSEQNALIRKELEVAYAHVALPVAARLMTR